MKGTTKRFGAVEALKAVDFTAHFGRIQALIGENGAGKTTLMRILYGSIPPTDGTIKLRGKEAVLRSAEDGISHRIGMVSQHYAIIPELTCLQNLMLGAEPSGWLDLRKAETRAEEISEKMGFAFDWHSSASTLGPAGAQKLEILKLLWKGAQIMILDEPTAMLSPQDSDALYASLADLAKQGACVIVVTHRLPEVQDHCEEATVLRGGELIASVDPAANSTDDLAELIVGRGVPTPLLDPATPGEPVLELRGAVALGSRGVRALNGVDLTLLEGEVLGIAGVDGSGQRELFQAILGHLPLRAGHLTVLEGAGTPSSRLACGLRLIPEDRHGEGVIEGWSLVENARLGIQRTSVPQDRTFAAAAAAKFKTRFDSLAQPMSSLSGGNQQRFVAGRALCSSPRLILAFQPARGLDVAGASEVYEEIRQLARQEGAAALVVSFDLDELIAHTDRIVAMRDGKLFSPGRDAGRDRAAIGRLMVGGST